MDDEIISPWDTHNHPSDAAQLEAEKITTIKRKAMESAQPIPTLYLNEVHQLASRADMAEIAAKLPTFQSAVPSKVKEAALYATILHWGSFWKWMGIDGKRFLLVEDGDDKKKIIIFATDDNMKLLAEAETLFVDGTFHICPEIFIKSSLFMPSKMANSFHSLTAFYLTRLAVLISGPLLF